MAKRPKKTKAGNTTTMQYSNGTVVEIKTTKLYSAKNLGDLNDKRRGRGKSNKRSKKKK
jgi:hypothetical protein